MSGVDDAVAWFSDEDGNSSITSTPDFKCGRHGESSLEMLAVQEMEQEALGFVLGDNIRPLSAQLLADARIAHWPMIDHIIGVEYKPGWTIKQWISALRAEVIRITCGTVIIYLEVAQAFQDVPPLKNNLMALCKVIRQHQRNVKIFIANWLPKPSESPLAKTRIEADFLLVQAVRSTNWALGKIHYLSVFEHFV